MIVWPADLSNTNLVEDLYIKLSNTGELKDAMKATLAPMTSQQCHRLIAFMPHCIVAVINAKGAPTKKRMYK